ncbi:MAG: carboxy terminal-processing peptidase, partial [Marinirhabdus sp.]
KPFDYTAKESLNADYENIPYVTSEAEMRERWRLQLKSNAIGSYYALIEEQKPKAENTATTEKKTPVQLEEEARDLTRTSLEEYFEFTDDLERKDYFAVFLNAIVEENDPHTNYFAPPDRDRFDLRMSGKLEGIGARLQKRNDFVKIIEIISGGPAWRGEHLEVGDLIMKVKQEDEEDPVSIVGMRLDDAVKLIKGPKGTKVTLTVKRLDGTIEEETITRDVVELEETYAKSTLIGKGEKKFGLINLPQFYFDMENYAQRNAAGDVRREVESLKKENIEGLVLDLRNNGGGSLRTAVDIAGLFIKEGPIVQVASGGKRKEVLNDKDESIVWDGPLVILINELSASASEILAAAMQDYKRAVIIGSAQSYGKGTVQNMIDLNQWLRNNDVGDMGALKMTTQKFYRVNGGSTQLEGVKSDVVMPDRYSYIDSGERDYDNPLPYDKISPAQYKLWDGYIDYGQTIAKSNERIKKNQQLALIEDNARYFKTLRDDNSINLNFEEYVAEVEERENNSKKYEAIGKYDNKLNYRSLPSEIEM